MYEFIHSRSSQFDLETWIRLFQSVMTTPSSIALVFSARSLWNSHDCFFFLLLHDFDPCRTRQRFLEGFCNEYSVAEVHRPVAQLLFSRIVFPRLWLRYLRFTDEVRALIDTTTYTTLCGGKRSSFSILTVFFFLAS